MAADVEEEVETLPKVGGSFAEEQKASGSFAKTQHKNKMASD